MSDEKKQSWWDEPFKYSNILIPTAVIICTFGMIGSWFFLVMSWNDIPTDATIIFNIDEYKEHLKSLRNELHDIDCDVLAKNLLSGVYSKEYGLLYSDYDFADKEYGYKCLGKERPQITEYERFTITRGKK